MCLSKQKYFFYATWWVSFGCCCYFFEVYGWKYIITGQLKKHDAIAAENSAAQIQKIC